MKSKFFKTAALNAVILGFLLMVMGCPQAQDPQNSSLSITVTLTSTLGTITGNPALVMQQAGMTKYTITPTYNTVSGSQVGTASQSGIVSGNYDLVIVVNCANSPSGSSSFTSVTVNGMNQSITPTISSAPAGGAPYTVTFANVSINPTGTLAVSIDGNVP